MASASIPYQLHLRRSRELLVQPLKGKKVTYFRTYGNTGDKLINAGARQVLATTTYSEYDIRDAPYLEGDVAIVGGGGGWCFPWHDMPALIRPIERGFHKVFVWPSSFDVREPHVAKWLRATKATLYVREPHSLSAVSQFCEATLALDTAFFFDYRPWLRIGQQRHRLFAFRTDREKRLEGLPRENLDVSIAAADLDHWLHLIARHAEIWTDRAHVMIAAALLRKRVFYTESSYHKLTGIAEYALGNFVKHKEPSDRWFVPLKSIAMKSHLLIK